MLMALTSKTCSQTKLCTTHSKESQINFYSRLEEETYLVLLNNPRKWICQFASTYCCEQAVSIMKINKSRLRTRVTDGHLDAVMRIAVSSWKQNLSTLVQWICVHCSAFLRELFSYMCFWKCKQLFVVLCNKEVRFYYSIWAIHLSWCSLQLSFKQMFGLNIY